MSRSMGTGTTSVDARRLQRAVEQLRTDLGRTKDELSSVKKQVAALKAQVGDVADRDGDGLPDGLDIEGNA